MRKVTNVVIIARCVSVDDLSSSGVTLALGRTQEDIRVAVGAIAE